MATIKEQNHLYIADSESSSVRSIETKTGAVKACVGGERDPTVRRCLRNCDTLENKIYKFLKFKPGRKAISILRKIGERTPRVNCVYCITRGMVKSTRKCCFILLFTLIG